MQRRIPDTTWRFRSLREFFPSGPSRASGAASHPAATNGCDLAASLLSMKVKADHVRDTHRTARTW